jgi:hypothetical protein
MRLLTSILFILVAGCVGDIGGENGGGGDDDDGGGGGGGGDKRAAKEVYKSDVHPVLAKCSGNGCHDIGATATTAVGKFYNTDPEMSYVAIVAAPTIVENFVSTAKVLTHITLGHKGLTYSADDQTKITNWLAKETTERSGGGGSNQPPPVDPKVLLKEWSGCMSLDNFTAATMTQAWSGLAASNLQKCINCHNGPVAGFLIYTQAPLYFAALSENTAYLLKYFTVNNAEGKVVVNTASFKSAAMIQGHPYFEAENNLGMTALKKFYESTMLRKTAGTCDPPRLKD